MVYPKLLSIIGLLTLTACSGGGNAKPAEPTGVEVPPAAQTPAGGSTGSLTHPVYGTLTQAQAVLLGPDVDVNGVRDDVDQFIAKHFSTTPLARKAVTAYAKEVTGSILFSEKLISANESNRRLAVFFCASDELERASVPNSSNWNSVIIAQITDTEDRLRAYDHWDRAQNVSTTINMETDSCAQAGL